MKREKEGWEKEDVKERKEKKLRKVFEKGTKNKIKYRRGENPPFVFTFARCLAALGG